MAVGGLRLHLFSRKLGSVLIPGMDFHSSYQNEALWSGAPSHLCAVFHS